MTGRVRRVAERIRQELGAIERVVRRAGRAMAAARRRPEEQDLYLDSAALCLDGSFIPQLHLREPSAMNHEPSSIASRFTFHVLTFHDSVLCPSVTPNE